MIKTYLDTNILLDFLLGREGCKDAALILRKNIGRDKALDAIITLYSTLKNCGPDFEDTLQKECAESAFCDYFLTRNPKDYPNCAIPVLSPKEFLNFCKE